MKSEYFYTLNNPSIKSEFYTVGMEVEFKLKTKYMREKYRKSVLLDNEYYPRTDQTILGYDGDGSTQEFRSPVFLSTNPEESIKEMEKYVVTVKDFLRRNFKSLFAPYLFYSPVGIHVSMGGVYLQDIRIINEIINTCKQIQPILSSRLESEEDKELFYMREKRYKGNILYDFKCIDSLYKDGRHLSHHINAIRLNKDYYSGTERIEFRFFPSCDVETLFPYIEAILLSKSIPDSRIKFIKP